MSDIVERLRVTGAERQRTTAHDDPTHYLHVVAKISNADGLLLHEAAATITRLRERLEIDQSHPYDGIYCRNETIRLQDAEITRLTAENARLRAALRDAYEVYAGSDGFIPATAAEGYQQQIIKQMVDCISAALSPPQEPRT